MSRSICCVEADGADAAGSYLRSAEALWRSSVRRSSSTFSARACAVASASRARRPRPSLALAAAFSSAAACAIGPPCLACWGVVSAHLLLGLLVSCQNQAGRFTVVTAVTASLHSGRFWVQSLASNTISTHVRPIAVVMDPAVTYPFCFIVHQTKTKDRSCRIQPHICWPYLLEVGVQESRRKAQRLPMLGTHTALQFIHRKTPLQHSTKHLFLPTCEV